MACLRLATVALVVSLFGGAWAGEGVGDYKGVTPGERREAPRSAKPRPKEPTLTWIGFQPLEGGGARVFVQVSHSFTFDQRVEHGQLLVTLPGLRLDNENLQRFLDARFFATDVTVIKATRRSGRSGKKNGGAVELRIQFLKNEARKADAKQETGPDGYRYLYLDFKTS